MSMQLNVRYPEVGQYGPGKIPLACYEEMKRVVEEPETMQLLVEIAQDVGHTGVAFVTQDDPGVSIFDGDSEVVFALGEDIFYPGINEAPFGILLWDIIMRCHGINAPLP